MQFLLFTEQNTQIKLCNLIGCSITMWARYPQYLVNYFCAHTWLHYNRNIFTLCVHVQQEVEWLLCLSVCQLVSQSVDTKNLVRTWQTTSYEELWKARFRTLSKLIEQNHTSISLSFTVGQMLKHWMLLQTVHGLGALLGASCWSGNTRHTQVTFCTVC